MSVESLWIHPAALEEAEAAIDWYTQRSRRAAERFLDELDAAVDQISRNPGQYPSYDFGTQRKVLRRFPFVVVFRDVTVRVEISLLHMAAGGLAIGETASDDVIAFLIPNPFGTRRWLIDDGFQPSSCRLSPKVLCESTLAQFLTS